MPTFRRLKTEAPGNRALGAAEPQRVWDLMTARRMLEKLQQFDPEFIEQPLPERAAPKS